MTFKVLVSLKAKTPHGFMQLYPGQVIRMDYSRAENLVKNGKIKSVWNTEMTELISWFETADLPKQPFQLNVCRRIANPAKFYTSLKINIESGPKGPRARTGAFQEDLKLLHRLITVYPKNAKAI